ncbi:MAG: Flp family type IVb pilin [Frankiales bacterium]|nr:Flp family type IVb pilin [Frankiales bacterium]
MLTRLRRITAAREDAGASAVEYGLLVAAIAAVIVVVIFALGGVIKDAFTTTCGSIKASTTTTQNC